MRDFWRVLRLAFRYRWTFILSTVCALAVAVLWGGNIGALFPFVKVAFEGQSMQDWVAAEIDGSQQVIEKSKAEIAQLRQQLATLSQQNVPPQNRQAVHAKIGLAQSRIEADRAALDRFGRLQPYINRYLPADPFNTLVLITGLLLLGTLLKDLFLIGHNILVSKLAQLSTFALRKRFYRRTLRMDLATFGEEGTADLMSRFTHDMEQVANGLVVVFGKLVREPLKMTACLIGAGLICWRLLLLSLVFAPLAAFLIRWLAKMLKRANRRAMEDMAQIYSTLEETLRGIKVVKAFTNEPQERKRFHNHSKQYYKKAMRIARYDSLTRPMSEVMGIVAICLALLAGAWLVLSQETHLLGVRMCTLALSPAALLLFYGFLAGVADPVRKFSDVFARIQQAAAAAERIFERLDREPAIRDPENPVTLKRHQAALVFDHVEFGYRPDQPVLEAIDLTIGFQETVAIVGPNGCGKSTLANLIPRFYDPTGGTVRLDGISLKDLRVRDLRKQISLVSQEVLLFDNTVYNNIRYGSPHATREDVLRAAEQAQAHQFIEDELPEGYETIVGSMGGRLSGGQRQRIALARAILRDPAILILDEATSQIDLESEKAIQEVLEQFTRDRTTVIITHRMSILALADRIVVMQSGKILDVGSHEELLSRCGLYRRLYQIQFERPGDDDSLAA